MAHCRVVVVDDQILFRQAVADRLAAEPDMQVAGTAGSPQEAAELVRATRPDVALLDAGMASGHPAALIGRVLGCSPGTRVVVVTSIDRLQVATAAVRAGAAAWVPKEASVEQLLAVIREVRRSGRPASEHARRLARLVTAPRGPEDTASLLGVLTPREQEVLQLMVDGQTNRQIARTLVLSANTARTHTQKVLRKLGVHSQLDAVALARRAGMQVRGPAGTSAHPDGPDSGVSYDGACGTARLPQLT